MAAVGFVTKPTPDTLPESSAPPDLERASSAPGASATAGRPGSGMAGVMRRPRGSSPSSPPFVMATNRHGDWRQFYDYEEYRYLLAIAALAFLLVLDGSAGEAGVPT